MEKSCGLSCASHAIGTGLACEANGGGQLVHHISKCSTESAILALHLLDWLFSSFDEQEHVEPPGQSKQGYRKRRDPTCSHP